MGCSRPPLRLTPRVLLWDATEIAALLDRLADERDGGEKKPAADETAGLKSDDDDDNAAVMSRRTTGPRHD